MGSAPSFPEGDASIQKMLAGKILVTCKTTDGEFGRVYMDTLHLIKNSVSFQKTKKSFFSDEINQRAYVFLTQIDSTYLFTEDCDYSMLEFLRLRTQNNKLNYKVLDSVDYATNPEALRQISWDGGIPMKLFEDNNVYTTSFNSYTEYWQCGEKADYAPKYPFINPEKTSLRKNLAKSETKSVYDVLTKPIFVLSVIPFDNDAVWTDNLNGKSVETTLTTVKGEDIEGQGIDLNNDGILDAFWYVEVVDSPVAEWYARLYINYDGRWVPIWYTYFKEM